MLRLFINVAMVNMLLGSIIDLSHNNCSFCVTIKLSWMTQLKVLHKIIINVFSRACLHGDKPVSTERKPYSHDETVSMEGALGSHGA